MNVGAAPVEQVFASDSRHRSVLGHSRVGRARAIGQLRGLAARDPHGVVIPPRDAGRDLLLGQINLVLAELRLLEYVHEHAENVVKVLLQAVPGYGRRIRASGGLDFGRPRLQVIVELIAGLGFDAPSAPRLAIDFDQPDLVRRLLSRPAANAGDAPHERQFVIFLQENHHTVRQGQAARLLRMKRVQRGYTDLLPVRRLAACLERAGENGRRDRQSGNQAPSWSHYFPSFPDAPAISVDSIMPTVRLAATKVLLATRRTSALVTLSMRSTSWKK